MNKKMLLAAAAVLCCTASAAYADFPIKVNVGLPNVPNINIQTNTNNAPAEPAAPAQTQVQQAEPAEAQPAQAQPAQAQPAQAQPAPAPQPKDDMRSWEGWPNARWTVDGMNAPSNARLYLVEYTKDASQPIFKVEGKKVIFTNIAKGQCIAWGNSKPGYVNASNFRAPRKICLIAVYPGLGFDYFRFDKELINSYDDMAIKSTTSMRGKNCTQFDGLIK